MSIDEALEHAASGNAVLFLGAGFSVGAMNTKQAPFRTGAELARFLSARSGAPVDTPLEDAAEMFASRFGPDELIKELRREYTATDVTDAHRTIASLPWKRTYTTNYDNVFETSSGRAGKVVVPIAPDSKPSVTAKGDPLCIHLNGFINTLDRTTLWTSFKLTDTSYSTASLEQSEWAALFRQDVRFAKSVFFVGYSLADLDIKRILRSVPDLIAKTLFIQHDSVDLVTEARAKRFGQVLTIGMAGMAHTILSGNYHTPRPPSGLNIGRSVVEYAAPTSTRNPTDQEFINLIMLGEFNPALCLSDPVKPSLYACERAVVTTILDTLNNAGTRAVTLHSEIANGRTLALAQLALHAVASGWRVFMATHLSCHAESELRAIAELPGKVLLIVDDYPDWTRHMDGICRLAGDHFTVVTAARTTSHDVAADELEAVLSPLQSDEFNLNSLSEAELGWWVSTFDTYGLWGELAADSREHKTRFLADRCSRQIQGILLTLLNSPVIKARLETAATAIKGDSLSEKIAISIFALTILNQRVTVETITDIWGVDALDRESVRNNQGLANFIDISRSSVRVRSTASAEYLLRNFWTAAEIVSVLIEVARVADKLYGISIMYEGMFKSLMRFSSLQIVLPEKGKREAVIGYYETLKLFGRCQRVTLFWLQYAIGALVIGDLERARRYFDTSYALAERDGWDTFQIDNHYARYLLVRAAEEAPFEEAMGLFREARTLINRQIRDDKLHYPFRVASSYQGFFDRFQGRFSESELKEISQAADTVLQRINALPRERRFNKYVRRCEEAMKYIHGSIAGRLETGVKP